MDLEVLAQGNKYGLAGPEVGGRSELEVIKGKGDGEVEGVVGRFIYDDEAVFFRGEVVEVDTIFRRGEEVAELADFGLESDAVEQLDHIGVAGMLAEVFLEEDVEGHFEHEGVIDGDHADAGLAVPARLAAARDGGVHHVVGDEEECLQEFGEPAEGGGEEVFAFGEGAGEEEGGGVDDGEAAVAFSAQGVVVE